MTDRQDIRIGRLELAPDCGEVAYHFAFDYPTDIPAINWELSGEEVDVGILLWSSEVQVRRASGDRLLLGTLGSWTPSDHEPPKMMEAVEILARSADVAAAMRQQELFQMWHFGSRVFFKGGRSFYPFLRVSAGTVLQVRIVINPHPVLSAAVKLNILLHSTEQQPR